MKRFNIRLLSWLLSLTLLLSIVSCTQGSGSSDTTLGDAISSQAPETEPISFSITADYKLVRPDEAGDGEIDAIQLFSRAVKTVFGGCVFPRWILFALYFFSAVGSFKSAFKC